MPVLVIERRVLWVYLGLTLDKRKASRIFGVGVSETSARQQTRKARISTRLPSRSRRAREVRLGSPGTKSNTRAGAGETQDRERKRSKRLLCINDFGNLGKPWGPINVVIRAARFQGPRARSVARARHKRSHATRPPAPWSKCGTRNRCARPCSSPCRTERSRRWLRASDAAAGADLAGATPSGKDVDMAAADAPAAAPTGRRARAVWGSPGGALLCPTTGILRLCAMPP